MPGPSAEAHWTVLTNHGLVLLTIARNPNVRVRDIAEAVGITERATQAILRDLDHGGYIERSRVAGIATAYGAVQLSPTRCSSPRPWETWSTRSPLRRRLRTGSSSRAKPYY
jgi:predicted ArsR family transcriptional regulator